MTIRNALRTALAHTDEEGFGDEVDSDAVIEDAARGLLALYDDLGLAGESEYSAADQCEALYELLNSLGMEVA